MGSGMSKSVISDKKSIFELLREFREIDLDSLREAVAIEFAIEFALETAIEYLLSV